jgi:hypothetical protein
LEKAPVLVTHITCPSPRQQQHAPVAQPGRPVKPGQERCLGRFPQKGKGHGFKSRPGLQPPYHPRTVLLGSSTLLEMSNSIGPSGHLSHLLQYRLLRLFPVHPSRIHRSLHQFLKLLLEGQKLPIDIRTVDTIGIVRVLSAVLFVRFHRHSTALTARSERHSSDRNKSPYKN